MMRAAAAFLLLAALPAFAASQHVVGTRVSYSDYRQPINLGAVPPLATGSPVRMVVNFGAGSGRTIGAPVADRDEKTITITQAIRRGGPDEMALYLLDFGALPPGTYRATLTQSFPDDPAVAPQTESRTFIVQSPPPTSACSATLDPNHSMIRLTRTEAGTVHLHFEEHRQGYSPVYAPPSVVDIRSGHVDIEQPFADMLDFTQPNALPTHDTCHAEDIDLGELPPGGYRLWWSPIGTLGGKGRYVFGGGGQFVWSGTEMLCSTEPLFSASPGVVLSLNRVLPSRYIRKPAATISGNAITVVDYIDTESPILPWSPDVPPECGPSVVDVGPLAPGEYTVKWMLSDVMQEPQLIGIYHFAAPVPRVRGVRH